MKHRSVRLILAGIILAWASAARAQLMGGVVVTFPNGASPTDNVFASRSVVTLFAGTFLGAGCDVTSLPDGVYDFQVTDAAGRVLLSTDATTDRTFTVGGGVVTSVSGIHGTSTTICGSELIALAPFARTPNGSGVYRVWVTPAADFQSTACTAGCFFGFLPADSLVVNFVVREDARCLETHCVSGVVFQDLNGNGVRDAGEPGAAGVQIRATDSRGIATSTLTDADGFYSICGLTETDFVISEVVPPGHQQTFPTASRHISRYLSVGDFAYTLKFCNESFANLDFGNLALTGSITGMKFNDINGNGVLDSGEGGVAGVTIKIADAQGNPVASQATDANGNFSFADLTPGTYQLTETLPSGFVQTVPGGSGMITVPIAAGDSVTGILFGNQQLPTTGAISGTKFNDANGNGVMDAGEAGIPGVTINLLTSVGTLTTVSDASGNFFFNDLSPGTYALSENVPAGFRQTVPGGSGFVNVTVVAGTTASGVLFGNQAITGGAISGTKFNDANGNGVMDPGEGGLSGVTINVVGASGSVSTVTDANGGFFFNGLPAGTYAVSEVVPAGYRQTAPGGAGVITVTVIEGQTSAGILFGNQVSAATGSISGLVFEDFNKNGVQDAGEGGMQNVTVNLRDASGTIVATTTTDVIGVMGHFVFSNVPAGDYTVQPVPPPTFFQTVPANDAPIAVHLDPGQDVTGLIFGLTC
jgi:serine-aspartate repeat-containing protein C/D/E